MVKADELDLALVIEFASICANLSRRRVEANETDSHHSFGKARINGVKLSHLRNLAHSILVVRHIL